jgi:hypothetical protein
LRFGHTPPALGIFICEKFGFIDPDGIRDGWRQGDAVFESFWIGFKCGFKHIGTICLNALG